MGVSGIPSGGGSTSFRSRTTHSALAEINVTPLVDVMLVLLIVFMISAPMMQQGIQIDLPQANAGSMNESPEQLMIAVDSDREISIAEHAIPKGSFFKKISAIAESKPSIEVVIQADRTVSYGFVAQVMAEVKRAGISRVGLMTHPGDVNLKL